MKWFLFQCCVVVSTKVKQVTSLRGITSEKQPFCGCWCDLYKQELVCLSYFLPNDLAISAAGLWNPCEANIQLIDGRCFARLTALR